MIFFLHTFKVNWELKRWPFLDAFFFSQKYDGRRKPCWLSELLFLFLLLLRSYRLIYIYLTKSTNNDKMCDDEKWGWNDGECDLTECLFSSCVGVLFVSLYLQKKNFGAIITNPTISNESRSCQFQFSF